MNDAFTDEDMHEEPVQWLPAQSLVEEAHALHQRILALGAEAKEKRQDLRETWEALGNALRHFYDDEGYCKAVGCDSWEEYVGQFDVAEALANAAGVGELSPSGRSVTAGILMLMPYAEENLFRRGLYSRVANSMHYLQEQRKTIEAAMTERTKKRAVAELNQTIEDMQNIPHRQVARDYQSHRSPPCQVNQPAETIYLNDAANNLVLATEGHGRGATFRLVSCLTGGRWLKFYWDEDGIYWIDHTTGEGGRVARWARKMGDDEMRAIVAHIPDCKRRMA